MIKCNLAVLLAERNLKISEVSKKTGISRTTLTALTQNQSKGIQFDTFDTICNFLKVTPNELFIQELLEYNFVVKETLNSDDESIDLVIDAHVKYKTELIRETFKCVISLFSESKSDNIDRIGIHPHYTDDLFRLIISIPIPFKISMEQELIDCIMDEIKFRYYIDNGIEASIY
ncbi:helix-turn-helix domain-containing protein [Lysinibacillus fusiformis]|uniref:helix-turn-helix domain-containing protein n=1 Tax=Lysinibacillus fusiformis TaxID=28031 RepID=UPI0021C0D98D|nr:helix-turn-helix transcriptional regulator [Lysinibacillus fusiformis]UXJ67777.1 helix-turn-helix transcriptional regulator [Lysinibacillus fusiformis]